MGGGTSGERPGSRIEVPNALRSYMEAPKALNRVESGKGVENAFLAYFLVTEHFWLTEKCDL